MFFIYKIYYEKAGLVYIGRTTQKIETRMRNHFIKEPSKRKLDVRNVSRIEFSSLNSLSDMYMYELYYINKYKPILNKKDKANDNMSFDLPDLIFQEIPIYKLNEWREQVNSRDTDYNSKIKNYNDLCLEYLSSSNRKEGMTNGEFFHWRQQEKERVERSKPKW